MKGGVTGGTMGVGIEGATGAETGVPTGEVMEGGVTGDKTGAETGGTTLGPTGGVMEGGAIGDIMGVETGGPTGAETGSAIRFPPPQTQQAVEAVIPEGEG